MYKYLERKEETIALIRRLSNDLEKLSEGKISTNDVSPERLWWEIFNKIFAILATCENCIVTKDSLTAHLIARYTYEVLIISGYIFIDDNDAQKKIEQFVNFDQFQRAECKWTDKTYIQMIKEIPGDSRFSFHKEFYRKLCNFAHPTMDSFLLNRRGDKFEFLMILNTAHLTIDTILEIVKLCFEKNVYFSDKQKTIFDISAISTKSKKLMKELEVSQQKGSNIVP